jgi:hypothetical protein
MIEPLVAPSIAVIFVFQEASTNAWESNFKSPETSMLEQKLGPNTGTLLDHTFEFRMLLIAGGKLCSYHDKTNTQTIISKKYRYLFVMSNKLPFQRHCILIPERF